MHERTIQRLIDLLREAEAAAEGLPDELDAWGWDEENNDDVFVEVALTKMDYANIEKVQRLIDEVFDVVWDQRAITKSA